MSDQAELSRAVDHAWAKLRDDVGTENPQAGERVDEVRKILLSILRGENCSHPLLFAWMAMCTASDFSGSAHWSDEAQDAAERVLEWLEKTDDPRL